MLINNGISVKARSIIYLVCLFICFAITRLNAQFTAIPIGLPNAGNGTVSWGDYDNDGDLDILYTGDGVSKIYNNNNMSFIDANANLIGVYRSAASWGDYDNDGDLDIMLSGVTIDDIPYPTISKIYRNDNGIFVDIGADIIGAMHASVDWGDYDNDGDLDILITGFQPTLDISVAQIYRNDNGNFIDINANISQSNDYIYSSTWGDYDNDGDLDILVTSNHSRIYRNDNGTFVVAAGFLNVNDSSASWGDYDNDGDLDVVLSGMQNQETEVSKIYRNDNGSFIDINASLAPAAFSAVAWGDYDNDGDLDLLLTGWGILKIYRNDNGSFIDIYAREFRNVVSKAAWGDYDNDGDLDFVTTGGLYRNDTTIVNSPPTIPVLSINPQSGTFLVSNSSDSTTPLAGLSYNLRIGTSPGGIDALSPMANTFTGYRKIVSIEKKNLGNYELHPQTTYYASVQAIDNGFTGSPFSSEISFTTPPILLSYPNGGQTFVSGRTSYVRWVNNWVQNLHIKLSTDNGTNWINISASPVPSSPGLYYYTVPIANSNQCKIRILWAKDNSYFDDSDQVFSISSSSTEPTMSVTYPTASGINLTPGLPVSIAWTSSNVAAVSLDYTTDNGITWIPIVENRPATQTPYSWTTPNVMTNQGRIRVRSTVNGNYYDISDNTFTICKVTILSPNGGEVLTADYSGVATVPITWTAPYVGTVNLYYSTNNGSNWTSIASVAGSLGTYNWVLPALESITCRVKATHASTSLISDISNAVFTIRVPVKFINVNGGGFVNNNCNYTLRWKNTDITPTAQVHLEYSIDNSSWTRINASAVPVANLSHTFYMALGTATQVWFRMAVTGTNTVIAKSSSSLTVTGKTLHITQPTIGQGLAVDSYTTITWTADGCTNLNIDYTTDFGVTWTQIGTNVPSAQGYFVWLVPNITSTQCRIRLRDATHSYMNIESDGEFTILAITLIASFYGAPTTGVSDLVVQFHDQSIGYISAWAWDFDNDGTTDSNLQNPTWTYRRAGFYSVKLTVWDGPTSVTMTRTNYVYVQPMVADFVAGETSGFAPFTMQFTDLTPSDITEWAWDFDNDGTVDGDAQNPFWTYLFPGTYSVKQHVTNGYDSDDEIKANYITVTLDPALTHYVPSQYTTIQSAIDHCTDGDYIIVADGTYYENLVIEGKNLTIGSYFFVDADTTHITNTIIDGGNALNPDQASTLTILHGTARPVTAPHIVGFTIRNGSGRRIIQNIGGNTIEKRVGGGIYINQANPMFSYNKIEDNDADDEGGGSYAFQSLPNLGGMANAAVGIFNPGGNIFRHNRADIGADIYVQGVTVRDAVQLQNCSFEVFSPADTTVSNYWANSSSPLSFTGCSGVRTAITSDIYVATNGSDSANSGLSASSPFQTIDYALSRIYATAENPLVIHIAAGTYSPALTGERFPLQMVKYVSLQGAGQDETFLDAEANVDSPKRVINLDNLSGVSLSSLTLMGGFVTLTKNYNGGGIGVMNSELRIMNALITGNSSAGDGAGIYAYNSTVVIDSISAEYNAALGSGGGIYAKDTYITLSHSNIANNTVNKNGAGLFADAGSLHIYYNAFNANQATGSQSKGGGLSISGTAAAALTGNLISANNADNGAGIYLQNNTGLRLDRNRLLNNLADYNGGGLFLNTTTGSLTNNLIANNTASQRGGGWYCYSSPTLVNNTIVYNKANTQGGGLYLNTGSPTHANTIYHGNVTGTANNANQVYIYTETAEPEFRSCDLQGGSAAFALASGITYSGVYLDNITADPLFTNPPSGAGYAYPAATADFALQDASPCIDSGMAATDIALFPLDLSGNPRIDNSRIDIGAYEKVHYFGAMVEANPAALDFGRVNLSAGTVTLPLTVHNTGNLPLLITELSFAQPTGVFFALCSLLGQPILPGQSATVEVSFDPVSTGYQSADLIISNNSLNHPAYSISLSGIGIDATVSTPGNVQLNVVADDVHLSWDPVLADEQGNPYTPEGYIVLYSENADAVPDNYFFLGFTATTGFDHPQVARYRSKMFYRIIAVDATTRQSLTALDSTLRTRQSLTWGVVKAALQTRR